MEGSDRADTQRRLANVLYRNLFPGFGWGLGAFTLYVIYDDFIAAKKPSSHH